MNKELNFKTILTFLGILITISIILNSFKLVDTGNRGIEVRFGRVIEKSLSEGFYFFNPVTSKIIEYPVKEQAISSRTIVFTKDTQQTTIDFTVTYRPDPNLVGDIYANVGDRYALEDVVIKPIVLGTLKDSVGKVEASELVGKRDQVAKDSLSAIKEELANRSVLLTGMQFTNIDFADEYEKAVEEKATATQLALKAKNETIIVQEQANQKLISAKAEAESMRIRSQALTQNKSLIEYEAVQKWDGKLPQYMMGNSVPFINLNK
jgi:regulator of protease activity HflC (stomatin/prohibitin superfamily)